MEYDIYISYQQGRRHENVPIVKNVADHLEKEGYTVFFDINEKERINNDENLTILKNAQIVLVFLDGNIEEIKPDEGFYKELKILGQRVAEGFKGVRIYRYNLYERSQLQELIKRISDAETHEALAWLDRTMYGYDKERVDDSLQNVTKMVDSMMGAPNYVQWKAWEKSRRMLYIAIALLLMVLTGMVIYGVEQGKKNRDTGKATAGELKKPIILFEGGVTTKNFIDDIADSLISLFPNSLYIHHSSKIAWWMLLEDVMGDNQSRTHYFVVLSSMKITSFQDLLNDIGIDSEEFVKYRKIIEYKVGEVPMVVQLWPRKEFKELERTDTISIEELKQLLTHEDISVYTTTNQSGTTDKYRKMLGNSWPDNYKTLNKKTFASSNKSVLLVNEAFNYPKEEKNTLRLALVDENGERCKMEAYIYSIAFYDNEKGDYIIPEPVLRFLKELRERTGKPFDTVRNIETGGPNIIYSLDSAFMS